MTRIAEIKPFTVPPRSESPLYVFRQVIDGVQLETSDDGKGRRTIAPDTVEHYGDDLLAVLRSGTY